MNRLVSITSIPALILALAILVPDNTFGADGRLIVSRDMASLTRMSDVIAVGAVLGEAGLREVSRNPNDPSRPDPSLTVSFQDYSFAVDAVMKGQAPRTIIVTSARFGTVRKGERVGEFAYENFIPLDVGARYVLFLRTAPEMPGVYVLAFEPSRFKLGATAVASSNWKDVGAFFPANAAGEFLSQVRVAVESSSR